MLFSRRDGRYGEDCLDMIDIVWSFAPVFASINSRLGVERYLEFRSKMLRAISSRIITFLIESLTSTQSKHQGLVRMPGLRH